MNDVSNCSFMQTVQKGAPEPLPDSVWSGLYRELQTGLNELLISGERYSLIFTTLKDLEYDIDYLSHRGKKALGN